MPRTITPINDITPAPEAIPDRSKVAELYGQPLKTSSVKPELQTRETAFEQTRKLSLQDSFTINLLIMVPYILSFLSFQAILSLGSAVDIQRDLFLRAASMALVIPGLFPWIFSIIKLRNILWNYRLSLTALLAIYSAFLLPTLALSLHLRKEGVPDFVLLPATVILSQLFIALLIYALKDKNISIPLISLPASLVVIIVGCVAFL